jgi:LPPG:FO 2-phospho-L-lactate transferase
MICVLCGGTGAAKFLQGLQRVVPPAEITAIVNTGDDVVWWGLHVSPDVDSITYALAGILSRERGWGVEGDTFECHARMREMGAPAWFMLGDRDLATHLQRTQWLKGGRNLTSVTAEMARRLGVQSRILPMSDDPVETRVVTERGELSFQEYFVRERYGPVPSGVRYIGAEKAQPARGVIDCITQAQLVIVAPSNPITSIGPILAVPGIRPALRTTPATVVAVSPVIGESAVSGPAGELMRAHGLEVSIRGVAQVYGDFVDVLVADESDRKSTPRVEDLGIRVHCCRTMMQTEEDKVELARQVLAASKMRAGNRASQRETGQGTRLKAVSPRRS